jgi:ABC-2 type transport system permease protein
VSGAFGSVVRFELGFYLRRISTWIYFGMFFAIAFLMMNAAGGAWQSVGVAVGTGGGNVYVNSPHTLMMLITAISIFGVIVSAALFGNAAHRDYETGMHSLFFTSPISRFAYLGGRFVGSLLVGGVIFLSIPLGAWVGSLMPYLDAERFGPNSAAAYLQPYLVSILPNLLLTGGIFFALATLTRQMLPNYVGGAVLLVGYLLSENLAGDIENERVAALLDPFGMNMLSLATRYWTPAERNTLLLPIDGLVLWNRLLWVAVGATVFAIAYHRFRFTYQVPERRSRRVRAAAAAAEAAPAALVAPAVSGSRGGRVHLQQYLSLVRRGFWGIVANRYFFAILGAGLLFLVIGAGQVGTLYGTTTWPVTYEVLEVLGGMFAIFLLIIITFYAGELIWQERDARMSQVVDATPMPSWVPFAAKLTALALVVAVLQGVILVAGVLTQAWKGYTNFELGLYVQTLFGLRMLDYLLLSVLVMLVHTVVNHKYLGHLIVVLYFVATLFMAQFGFEHGLYQYGSDAGLTYSDMNGYGPFLSPFLWFKAYWAAWALLLAVLSNLLWVRGQETGAAWRLRLARMRFRRPAFTAAAVAALLITSLGSFVFYNTNVLNDYRTSHHRELEAAAYEREYKRFEDAAQPRIAGVALHVEIYPEARDVTVQGTYRLQNRTSVAIDSVHLRIPRETEIRALEFEGGAERVHEDRRLGYHIYRLASPLVPGDSLRLDFDLAYLTRGFENRVTRTQVVENGTFFNSSALPSLGYDARGEIADDQTRRKYDLPPRERMAPAEDLEARRDNYISSDSDWIDFEAVVGTVASQIAIAPGYLEREWTEGDRRYFHFRMDVPILGFYSFLSAEYAVRRDQWNPPAGSGDPVVIEVYHHPGHEYNLDRMIDAVKKSLDYYTAEFGPYQHRQVRILEFPRYASFAQAFPNTIPYSEAVGFIARVEDPEEDIDYPFYVTAHEVAHQWWAHQVIGGNVQGSTLLSETLSQYAALMVMEREYGRVQIGRFLRYELDNYLRGRAFERRKEMPLLRVEDQQYIHYNKGSLAMYALRESLGEAELNRALRSYLEEVKFQQPPYTSSLELYAHLQAATPDSLRSMLADLFEHITLWDNRTKQATATPLGDGRYEVVLEVEARKVRADSLGNESDVGMDEWVEVGVFAAAPRGSRGNEPPLYLQRHRIVSGSQEVRVVVEGEPARAGIDPRHLLIDRVTRDNVVAVRRAGG